MLYESLQNYTNQSITYLLTLLYKHFPFQSYEDSFHIDKKDSNVKQQNMNTVKMEFSKKNEFQQVKEKVYEKLAFLSPLKLDIPKDSIVDGDNNKLLVHFSTDESKELYEIFIYFNHYYVSGPFMFSLLNELSMSPPPIFLKTNYCLPFYYMFHFVSYVITQLWHTTFLNYKYYDKKPTYSTNMIHKKSLFSSNKRYDTYLQILKHIHAGLRTTRPLTVGLAMAFEPLPYLNNNVGIVLIEYTANDTAETLQKKIKDNFYHAYVTNLFLQIPTLLSSSGSNIRNLLDCIISSMYIKSDLNMKIAWNVAKAPVEEVYVGNISQIRTDGSIDLNIVFSSSSKQFQIDERLIEKEYFNN